MNIKLFSRKTMGFREKHACVTALAMSLVLLLALSSCSNRTAARADNAMSLLDDECMQYFVDNDFDKCDSAASILLHKAEKAKSERYRGKALLCLGRYNYRENDVPSRLPKLKEALAIAEREHDDTLLCRVYNQMGIYEIVHFRCYYRAQHYLTMSMKLGQQINDTPMAMTAESNLSEIYRLLQDTMSYSYDREIFDYAQLTGNKKLLRLSGFHLAYYMAKTKGIKELTPYIKILSQNPADSSLVEIIQAEFYMRQGDLKRAEQYAKKAIKGNDSFENILIVYAWILSKEGKYAESNEVLDRAEREYSTQKNDNNWIELYELRAANYHALGNDVLAYSNQQRYTQLKDSVSRLIHSEHININRVKYDVDKKNQEIERQRLVNRYQLIVASGVILVLLVELIATYLYVRRYKRFARNIVKQHKEAITNERLLRNRIDSQQPAPSDSKLEEIFGKISKEMEDNEIYCDSTVTRDTFSEKVGCNHTYLTYAIKKKTGMSYSQFMNSYRIRKAVEIPSDSSFTIPLKELSRKLGFIAVSTFYSEFRKQVGISPAAYRKTAAEMSKDTKAEV